MRAKGKVIEEEGKFFVTIKSYKYELTPNEFGTARMIKSLVGKEVEAIVNGPILAGLVFGDGKGWPCYVPPTDLRGILEIDPAIRAGLLKGFVNAGLIDAKTAEKVDQKYLKAGY